MAMENEKFIDIITQIFEELTGIKRQFYGVPENQWVEIREEFLQNENQVGNQVKKKGKTRLFPKP